MADKKNIDKKMNKNYSQNENHKFKENKNNNEQQTTYRTQELEDINKNKEDATKYGEFIPSAFNWLTLDQQKKRAEELENMTNNNKELEK